MPVKLGKEEAVNWIKENGLDHKFEIIEWSGISSSKSLFLDKSRNVRFQCEFSIFKRNLKRNPDATFGISKEEQSLKSKETFKAKYGVDHYSKTDEFKQKVRATNIEKYGQPNVMQTEVGQKSHQESMLKNLGVTHALKSSEIRERQRESTLRSTGVECTFDLPGVRERAVTASRSEESKSKRISSFLQRFGVDNPSKCLKIVEKKKENLLRERGYCYSFSIPEVKERIFATKIAKGTIKSYNGKTIAQLAKEFGYANSSFFALVQKHGFESAVGMSPQMTDIENVVFDILNELGVQNIVHNRQLEGSKYRPDFLTEEHKLIIECDGLFWHSDKVVESKSYHKDKRDHYLSLGYRCLFFRQDEIIGKRDIVKSVISNALKKNERKVFARKCDLVVLDHCNDFFEKNHLMRKGSGRCYALQFEGEIVAAIQVKHRNKSEKIIEVSRFCTLNQTSVVGGYSRLIKFMIKKENVRQIMSFVDLRYGSGNYMESLGFSIETEHLSFKWTNGKETFGRMQHPGNSGYECGLARIWDCGQAKWVRQVPTEERLRILGFEEASKEQRGQNLDQILDRFLH
jgi:very-short-patch-repair endonuclease